MTLLVRHASAGNRDEWTGDDADRPLDERGRAQALGLVERLTPFRIERILTSPARRCVETVEPLARARGLDAELRPEHGEDRQGTEGAALLRSLA
ncbi:MAG: NUDIX hydrolase, partial [Thermoleophilia bacterium]|nr:NUDIX hydrolase [Thermoleophilia bacterium]